MRVIPRHATIRVNGEDRVLPVEEIKQGDILLVKSGERIPADGVVLKGKASVDQSAITGESTPVEKEEADDVFGGTLNLQGALELRTTRTGSESTVGQIMRLIEDAKKDISCGENFRPLRYLFYPCNTDIGCFSFLGNPRYYEIRLGAHSRLPLRTCLGYTYSDYCGYRKRREERNNHKGRSISGSNGKG